MEVTIKNLVGNYRYKVAKLPNGAGYLVDLEAKPLDWISPFGGLFVKRKCYALIQDQLEKLDPAGREKKPEKTANLGWFVASATIIYRFLRPYLTFDLPFLVRTTSLVSILLVLVVFKVKYMISRKRRIEATLGPLIKLNQVSLKLRRLDFKLFLLKATVFAICAGAVVILSYTITLFSFDVLSVALYTVFLFFLLNLSLMALAIDKAYVVSPS